jgi:hypothetical protein
MQYVENRIYKYMFTPLFPIYFCNRFWWSVCLILMSWALILKKYLEWYQLQCKFNTKLLFQKCVLIFIIFHEIESLYNVIYIFVSFVLIFLNFYSCEKCSVCTTVSDIYVIAINDNLELISDAGHPVCNCHRGWACILWMWHSLSLLLLEIYFDALSLWNFKLSQWWVSRLWSFVIWHHIVVRYVPVFQRNLLPSTSE